MRASVRLACLVLLACVLSACAATVVPGIAAPVAGGPCSGDAVVKSPAGHFCYTVPAGFTDSTSVLKISAQAGANSTSNTAVGIGEHDLVIVSEFQLSGDSNTVGDDTLLGALLPGLRQLNDQGLTIDSLTPRKEQVDGARALVFTLRGTDTTSTSYFVFRGRTEVQINCQYQEHQSDIDRACGQVRSAIWISG